MNEVKNTESGRLKPIAGCELDFSVLQGSDEYTLYFNQLACAFERLLGCYRQQVDQGGNYEASVVASHLSSFLRTVEALRLKYTYSPDHLRSLWVDLSESGYPNGVEISALSVDREDSQRQLNDLPAASVLKHSFLDHLFQHLADSPRLLETLSRRAFLEFLSRSDLFLPFTPGEIKLLGEDDGFRSYAFSWGCYDHTTNRPYVHLMTFEQDSSLPPLDPTATATETFLDTIRNIGSRAPDLAVLALSIDDALDTIHPKILKRICIGPMYSYLLLRDRSSNDQDPREPILRDLLTSHSRDGNEFMLFFDNEIIFSKRQEVSRSLFSPRERVREIFAIEDSDPECVERRASLVHRYVLLPHHLIQHIPESVGRSIPGYEGARKMTFDDGGQVHGI